MKQSVYNNTFSKFKKILENIPNNVEITVTDLENVSFTEFDVKYYNYDNCDYLDIILPIYVEEFKEGE